MVRNHQKKVIFDSDYHLFRSGVMLMGLQKIPVYFSWKRRHMCPTDTFILFFCLVYSLLLVAFNLTLTLPRSLYLVLSNNPSSANSDQWLNSIEMDSRLIVNLSILGLKKTLALVREKGFAFIIISKRNFKNTLFCFKRDTQYGITEIL